MVLALVVCTVLATDLRGQERYFTIQVASVPTSEEAKAMLGELKKKGIAGYAVLVDIPGIGQRYRIRYGRFRTAVLAKVAAVREVGRGTFADFIVSREEVMAESRSSKPVQNTPQLLPPRPATPVASPPVSTGPVTVSAATMSEVVKSPDKTIEKPVSGEVIAVAKPLVPGTARKQPEVTVVRGRWEVIDPRTLPESRWRSLHFTDTLTGWAGGEDGQLYRTSDGGRSWRPVAIETTGTIEEITFADWNLGWVLVRESGNGGRSLLITRNGGRTWKKIELPGVERVYRIDGAHGWAIGGNDLLMRTVDGGETWSRSSGLPGKSVEGQPDLEDIVVSTTGLGWIIGNMRGENLPRSGGGCQTGGGCRIGGVWKTEDGGRSWKELALPGDLVDRQGRGRAGRLLSVRFFSRGNGVITGELAEGEGRAWFTLETGDGGESWKLAMQSGRELERAGFSPALLGSTSPDGVEKAGSIGFNGVTGWTWTSTIEADEVGGATHIETHLMTTGDGGRTWSEEFKLIGRHNLIGYIPGGTRGWVITERGLLITSRE